MESSLVQAFQQSTPPQWISIALLLVVIFFLKRLIKTFDKIQEDIAEIKISIVKHGEQGSDHERRITTIEKKLFG